MGNGTGKVLAVARDSGHYFSKPTIDSITLIAGLGIEGDAHLGEKVQHLHRIKKDPDVPNLRQVHLIHDELHQELNKNGFEITPGDMGENITTRGIDLLSLPQRTILKIGKEAEIEVTGLRNPCYQLNDFKDGLMQATLEKDSDGNLIRKSGIMAIVTKGGVVRPDDPIKVELPEKPFVALEPV